MSVSFTRHDDPAYVFVTLEGNIDAQEILAFGQDLRNSGLAHYGRIYDLRPGSTTVTMDTMRKLLTGIRAIAHHERAPGTALIASAPDLYSKCCAFAALAKPDVNVEVFHDRVEAEAWAARLRGDPQ
jgi:hypothetical protein